MLLTNRVKPLTLAHIQQVMIDPKTLAALIDALKTLLIVCSGVWVVYLFYLRRERFPKMEFSLDVTVLDKVDGQLFVEFLAYLENNGAVRHYIDVATFTLKIRYITAADIATLTNRTFVKCSERFTYYFNA